MKIPYGISDFGQIRAEGFFYADKTPFLPVLEAGYRYVVFLRPRRFGKSTLVSMLEHYYDLGRRDRFDALFGGLWVHEHPTAERGAYLVLTLDFSSVATDGGEDALRRTFVEAVRGRVGTFLLRYRERVPALGDLYEQLDGFEDAEALIGQVLSVVAATPHKIYLLIDEYDHFANRLLSAGDGAACTRRSSRRPGSCARSTRRSSRARVGRGGAHVRHRRLAAHARRPLERLQHRHPRLAWTSASPRSPASPGRTRSAPWTSSWPRARRSPSDPRARRPGRAALACSRSYYNGYRFSPRARERVFNSDMVLYFLSAARSIGRVPRATCST